MSFPTPIHFAEIINRYFSPAEATLLNGILFGIPVTHEWWLYQKLINVGLIHLVVLSGMNITLLIQLVMTITFYFPKKLRYIISIVTIVLFILFVGIQPPIIRAAFMGILSCLGFLIGRKVNSMYALLLSGILSLILWPDWFSSLSFQLSYASTTGLILFGKPLITYSGRNPFLLVIMYCFNELQISLAAQILTIPLIWYVFGRISYISPLSNLLVGWTIYPLMILGFIICILGSINFELGKLPLFFTHVLISYIISVVNFISQWLS